MNPLNAGLPRQAAIGSQPVGVSGVFPKGSAIIVDESGGEWLASGSSALATVYTKAAKLSHLQLHGTTKALGVSLPTTLAWSIAVSDAGIILLAYGATSSIRRSTDGGQTWTTVGSLGLGGLAISHVVWNAVAQRFYILANDTTTYYGQMSTTADGSAFNTVFSAAMGGTGPHVAGTLRSVVNPSSGRITLRATFGTTGPNHTIDSGAQAFTQRNLIPNAISQMTRLACNTAGTLIVDMPIAGGVLMNQSVNDGVTFSNPGNTWFSPAGESDCYPVWLPAANAFLTFTAAARYYVNASAFTTADYVQFALPGTRFAGSQISFVGNALCVGIKDPQGQAARQFLVTADGYSWKAKGTSVGISGNGKGLAVFGGSLGCVIAPVDDGVAQSTSLQTPSLESPVYVGTPYVSDLQVAAGNPPTLFVKVK